MAKPTVAVIGASSDRSKFGNKSVRAHRACGYTVYPVHPRETEIEDLPVYSSVANVPAERLDRVTLYLPPSVGIRLLEEIAAKGCDELWLNPGTESPELMAEAERLGLNAIQGCSIVQLGVSPGDFPE